MPDSHNLLEDIKQVLDITSRVDERAKIIADNQHKINDRLDHFIGEHNSLVSRVYVLESKNGNRFAEILDDVEEKINKLTNRVERLEDHKNSTADKYKIFFGYIWQGLFIVLICYVLFRLGISSPPIP